MNSLSPAERHAGSAVATPFGFLRSDAGAIICVAAFDFLVSRSGVNRPQYATGLKLLSQSPQLMSDTEKDLLPYLLKPKDISRRCEVRSGSL